MIYLKKIAATALLSIVFVTTGCDKFERTTFQTLSASRDVINQAQADYEGRKIPHNQCAFALINNAKALQTTAAQAMVVYEEEKSTQKDVTAQKALVVSTVAGIPPLVVKIKGLYTNPNACEVTP